MALFNLLITGSECEKLNINNEVLIFAVSVFILLKTPAPAGFFFAISVNKQPVCRQADLTI